MNTTRGQGRARFFIRPATETWHEMIVNPTLSDSTLNQLVHIAHLIKLKANPCNAIGELSGPVHQKSYNHVSIETDNYMRLPAKSRPLICWVMVPFGHRSRKKSVALIEWRVVPCFSQMRTFSMRRALSLVCCYRELWTL